MVDVWMDECWENHVLFVFNKLMRCLVCVIVSNSIIRIIKYFQYFILFQSIYNKSKIETCKSDNLDCYVLDNNGYVIASDEEKKYATGLFFGAVHPDVMRSMVNAKIYKKITYYDHQAVCFEVENLPDDMNSGRRLLTVSPSLPAS